MKKSIRRWLLNINSALALVLLLAVSSGNAQSFPEGLVGLSSSDPATLYSIDMSNGTATPIVTLDGEARDTGLSYIEGTLFGTNLGGFPGSQSGTDIGSIAPDGTITFLSNQNNSDEWQGLASDDCRENALYTTDVDDGDILTLQFLNGDIETIGSESPIQFVGMAYDDIHRILYALSFGGSLYTISTSDGTSSLIGATGMLNTGRSMGLAYDEDNKILYANDGENLYSLNISNGEGTLIGSNNTDELIAGLAWLDDCIPTRNVPTLSEWGLIAMAGVLGIIGLLALRRRKAVVS